MKRSLLNLSRKGGFLEVYPLVERVRRNVMVDCDHMDARFLSSCYSSYRQILLWVIASTLTTGTVHHRDWQVVPLGGVPSAAPWIGSCQDSPHEI